MNIAKKRGPGRPQNPYTAAAIEALLLVEPGGLVRAPAVAMTDDEKRGFKNALAILRKKGIRFRQTDEGYVRKLDVADAEKMAEASR